MVGAIGDDDAMMMLVDRNASRILELEISRALLADTRKDRLVSQRLYAATSSDEDAIMLDIQRYALRVHEPSGLVAFLAEVRHERAILR